MSHISDHDLMAYRDNQMDAEQTQIIQQHLDQCARCQVRYQEAQRRGQMIQTRLRALKISSTPYNLSIYRARLDTHLHENSKESNTMFTFFRQHRVFSALALVVLALVFSLAIPSVRAFAAQVLAIFRVQDTTVLPIDINNLPDNYAQAADSLFYLVAEDTQYTTTGQIEQVESAERASQSAGFDVRLPDLPYQPSSIVVERQVEGTFTINLSKAQAILAEMNRSDLLLPQEWDGAIISFSVPRAVITEYSGCGIEEEVQQTCMVFVQIPSPTISAPDNVDVRQVGKIFLQLSGMTSEEAEAYSSQVDWLSTLIIPVPQPDASYQTVMVDGVKGTLIEANSESQEHVLIWVKDNIIYAISAAGDPTPTLNAANNIP